MKRFVGIVAIVAVVTVTGWRMPLTYGTWNKQTLYVSALDVCHGRSSDSIARALWMDDDSGQGVFTVKRIGDETGVKPVFAVVAGLMTDTVCSALAHWQRQGEVAIVLHGLRHERWTAWDEGRIAAELAQCRRQLAERGFDTTALLPVIVPPHSGNNSTIRQTVRNHRCRMVTGAELVNPDKEVFQWGRIPITPQTDTTAMRKLLYKAYKRKGFVVFSTHSSMPGAFSEENTRKVLTMAKEMGFCFDFID